jgi:hypothetical protein
MSRRPITRTLGWLVAAVLVASLLLPFYVWFTLRQVRLVEKRAQESEHRAREAEVHLRATEENHKTAQRELAKTRADLQETISKKLDAERQLVVAREKFEELKKGAIPLARFLKEGLGISTPAARSNDVAAELRRLRGSQQWSEATARAVGWLGFHRTSPSTADYSALIEVALLWKRLADLDARFWKTAPFKTKRAALLAANEIFEEAEGKATEAQPKPFVAGDWGTMLRDLANATRDPAEVGRYRKNATRLLEIAIKGAPGDDAWLLNRVYLEQDILKRDPAGFAAYCEGIRPSSRVAMACGKVLFALATAKQISVSDSERKILVCKAAKWTAGAPHIQAECDRETHRPHRQ